MKWDSIDTFFLDMDGTLLDLSFDNFFWHKHMPYLYAEMHNMSYQEAKLILKIMYKEKQGTLDWYSIDYWSDILKIDLTSELFKTKNNIKVFPGTISFLCKLKKRKMRIILITNCPTKMINVKFTQTKLWSYFDKIISSEDYGFAKETDNFWIYLKKELIYNEDKTVFIDDSQNVLEFALRNGIKNVISINLPDSKKKKQNIKVYKSIDSISDFEDKIIN